MTQSVPIPRVRPSPFGRGCREERVNEFRDGGKTRQPLRENQRVTTSFSSVPKFVHTFEAASEGAPIVPSTPSSGASRHFLPEGEGLAALSDHRIEEAE